MNEPKLIGGAEYEGKDASGDLCRGKLELKYGVTSYVALRIAPTCLVYVRLDTLRRIPPEPVVAEKDKLFETGCCFCGFSEESSKKNSVSTRSSEPGYRYCSNCWDLLGPCARLDIEYERRRKAIASGSVGDDRCPTICPDGRRCDLKNGHGEVHQTSVTLPATDWNVVCCQCGQLRTHHAPHCSYYCNPNAGPERPAADAMLCARCGGTPDATHNPLEPTGLCAMCTADVMSADKREGSNAEDLAWCLRVNAAFAEEQKRRHYEERCAAYRDERAESDANGAKMNRRTVEKEQRRHAAYLDRAIAKARAKEDDGPAYVNHNWPPADDNDP